MITTTFNHHRNLVDWLPLLNAGLIDDEDLHMLLNSREAHCPVFGGYIFHPPRYVSS